MEMPPLEDVPMHQENEEEIDPNPKDMDLEGIYLQGIVDAFDTKISNLFWLSISNVFGKLCAKMLKDLLDHIFILAHLRPLWSKPIGQICPRIP
jgi:hypothetical protein